MSKSEARRKAATARADYEQHEKRVIRKAFDGNATFEEVADLLSVAPTGSGMLNMIIDYVVGGWVNDGGGWRHKKGSGERVRDHGTARDCTRCLDDAITLVPEGMYWLMRSHDKADGRNPEAYGKAAFASVYPWHDEVIHQAYAATPALALCIAALKARGAQP